MPTATATRKSTSAKKTAAKKTTAKPAVKATSTPVRLMLKPDITRPEVEAIAKKHGCSIVKWDNSDPFCPDVTFEAPNEMEAKHLMETLGYATAQVLDVKSYEQKAS